MPKLTFPVRDYGLLRQMKKGTILANGCEIEFPHFDNILVAARQMVREGTFDICEMPTTTYIAAKAYNKPLIALPTPITRNFHHQAIHVDTRTGITNPKDFEGQTVGVVRGYTVTTGVWARAVLSEEYNVDLGSITWAATDDEHVAEFEPPNTVDLSFRGRDMNEMFENREIVGAVGTVVNPPDYVKPLLPDPKNAGFRAYKTTGLYPINHSVVVHLDTLDKFPDLPEQLFAALTASKKEYLENLDESTDASNEDKLTATLRDAVGGDPFPYGVNKNRQALETLCRQADMQQITKRLYSIEDLMAESTLNLEG